MDLFTVKQNKGNNQCTEVNQLRANYPPMYTMNISYNRAFIVSFNREENIRTKLELGG